MIKSELIQKLTLQYPNLHQSEVENIVNVILEEITNTLANGGRVELRGFGAFSVKHRPPRQARNPKTGSKVMVDEKFVPVFKTGKDLHRRLNEGYESS